MLKGRKNKYMLKLAKCQPQGENQRLTMVSLEEQKKLQAKQQNKSAKELNAT